MGRAHEVRAASMAKTAAIKSKLYKFSFILIPPIYFKYIVLLLYVIEFMLTSSK